MSPLLANVLKKVVEPNRVDIKRESYTMRKAKLKMTILKRLLNFLVISPLQIKGK
jgi:hypothetical protein